MEPVTDVLKLLQILMSPRTGSDQGKTVAADERQLFDLSLQATLSTFREELSKLQDASSVAKEIRTEFPHEPENCKDIRWMFVLYCLKLMNLLAVSIERAMDEFKKSQQGSMKRSGPNDAPPLSPDTLSFGQQKMVLTALQFIACMGIVPCLERGVGVPLENRSGFGSILSGSRKIPTEERCERLLHIVRVLLQCSQQVSLGGLIFSRHLGDLLAGLVQLCHSPQTRVKDKLQLDREKSSEELQSNVQTVSDGTGQNGVASRRCKDDDHVDQPLFTSPADIGCQPKQTEQTPHKSAKDCNKEICEGVVKDSKTADKCDTINNEDEAYCKTELEKLLTKTYQPLVIKELLLLHGGPGGGGKVKTQADKQSSKNPLPRAPLWLTKICGQLLAERMMQPKGVQNVLKAILNVGGGQGSAKQTSNWEKCDAVAKLISSCPLQSDKQDGYYQVICPQVLKLLYIKDQLMLQQTLRVACTCIAAIVDQYPDLAEKYLIQPLLKPLLDTLSTKELSLGDDQPAEIAVISETTLSKCIECIHKMYVIGAEPNSQLITTMERVVDPLFKLFCFARQGVCNLRSAVEELLVNFFLQSKKSISLQYLRHVTFVEKNCDMAAMHDNVTFVPGSQGGAVAVYRVSVSEEELFSESLMNQESVAESTLVLLQHLKKDGLTGDYFIILLQELTAIISKPKATTPNRTSSEQFLELEVNQSKQIKHLQHCLQILAILSKMCETQGPDLLENTGHILSFVKATFERACQSLDAEGSDAIDAFETETLTMAFGLTSTLLMGDGETAEYKQVFMELIPLLEQISNLHPQQPIRVMATELRITVATHGTVWSENMKDTIQELRTKAQQRYFKENEKHKQSSVDDTQSDARHKGAGVKSTKGNGDNTVTERQSEEEAVSKEFDEAFQELFDPLLPVRGHALMALAKLLQSHDGKAMQKKDTLLKIFEENLTHEDSYIYLSAIKGLVALVDVFPDQVVSKLCAEFAGTQKEETPLHRTVETRLKIGEALVKATRCLGDLVPHYSQQLLGAFLVGTRDSDPSMRASSLSNLADVCQLLRFSVGPIVHEIMNCVSTLLKTDPEVEVRRACVLVITLILKGLGSNALQVLEGVMRDLYRQLKLAITVEKDDVLLLHAQLALEELDIIMKDYLFPKQTLSKKITVLP
ncbi:transport and Golgi organization protein 6 homolog [Amphiura filiformis]|uniref:transport and Golgi organization protein 6 homolog n=1 Tax=Amphiura filiformis TaxID=82378 RepID=UPI003B2121C9